METPHGLPAAAQGFRVRHFLQFWLFFTRRNKKMRQAWISTAAQHIEAMLRNAMNAFKANAADGRRLRRIKRTVFEGILHMTQRNKAVRRISREVRAAVSRRGEKGDPGEHLPAFASGDFHLLPLC